MASFQEIKENLLNSFVPEGAEGIEALIQINIDGLTNFYISIQSGALEIEEGEKEDGQGGEAQGAAREGEEEAADLGGGGHSYKSNKKT